MKVDSRFLQYRRQFCLDSLIQLRHLFDLGFLPYEAVFVCVGFDFRSVNEYCFQVNQSRFNQHLIQLLQQFLPGPFA